MIPDDFLDLVRCDNERLPHVHLVMPGATPADFHEVANRLPGADLPADLIAFWNRTNGMRLWRETIQGKYIHDGALQLYPLDGFRSGVDELCGGQPHPSVPASWLVIGTDQDGTSYVVYDSANGEYLKVEPIVPSEAQIVASSLEGLLQWIVSYERLVGGDLPYETQ